jgi:outer membrane lipoprotein SlyB
MNKINKILLITPRKFLHSLKLRQILSLFVIMTLSSCARDLSMNTYSSDSVLSLTLEGKVISVREVTIKNSDKLGDNTKGALGGAAAGALVGASMGNSSTSRVVLGVGGAIISGIVGAGIESRLSKTKGYEYIVKVDISKLKDDYYEGSPAMRAAISSATTSGLIAVLQGKDVVIPPKTQVYVIFSDSRVRIVPITE